MSMDSDVLSLIRNMVDDTTEPYEFSDDRLLSLAYTAASIVNLDISGEYEISLCDKSISPEPSSNLIALISLKASCMLIRSQHTSFARSDFRVTDGPATVDLKGSADKLKSAADTVCAQYEKSRNLYISTDGGYVISTPNSNSS